ncbi:hypothetical protein I8746_06385 [Pseudomonas sp. USTB-Z]|uniref:hypothetical protein n=1 Tax=Pseudomonas TaxID=286 RepID=UPI0018ABC34C|nr:MULTISPECIES: hypothetical protein [Pseudomonas]MBF8789051.1 hypothetical protein [Pseudomonas asiatica]MBX6689222.1 hypothetical protein [Pseudomonas sp. USTB-Z]
MPIINIQAFEKVAKTDPEFVRETRYFNGTLKLVAGSEQHHLTFQEGKLEAVDSGESDDTVTEIMVKGTPEHWKEMLAEKPKPFFQSLQSTAVKHGLSISDSHATFAYLPALNRMMQLLRQIHSQEC